jgi:hypothetical protein
LTVALEDTYRRSWFRRAVARRGHPHVLHRAEVFMVLSLSGIRPVQLFGVVALAASSASCGGIDLSTSLPYERIDASFQGSPRTDVTMFSVTCKDKKRGKTPGAAKFVTTCSGKDGAFPWKVVGVYKIPPAAGSYWQGFEAGVKIAAGTLGLGCPAVAVRDAAPKVAHTGEVVGAFCVDPSQPSGFAGPLKVRTSLVPGEGAKIVTKGGGKKAKAAAAAAAAQPAEGEEDEGDEE